MRFHRASTLAACLAAISCGDPASSISSPDAGRTSDAGNCPTERVCGTACCATSQACVKNKCTACGCTYEQCGMDACGKTSCGTCPATMACDLTIGMCAAPATCRAGQTACGTDCCDDATETCSAGTCRPIAGCLASQTSCGSDCCDNATETCASGACRPIAGCLANQTPCGADCCDDVTETCYLGACRPISGCQANQTACGSNCCDNATQVCSGGSCLSQAGSCNPLLRTGCSTGQGCYYDGSGYSCASAGSGRPGDTCSQGPDCASGNDCGCDNMGTCFCFVYCNPAGANTCTGSEVCNDFDDGTGYCGSGGSTGSCDPLAGTGCAAGEGCYWDGVGYACATAGPGGPGAICTQGADCRARHDCLCYTADNCVCFLYCDPAGANTCPGNEACGDFGDGTGYCDAGGSAGSCDPLAGTGCAADEGCYYDGAGGYACAAAGTGLPGTPCDQGPDCAVRHDCGCDSTNPNNCTCYLYCDPAGANTCTGGEVCNDFDDGTGYCG